MQQTQLGRILLSNTSSSSDEMRAEPDEAGRYDGLDEFLDEISARTGRRSHRRPRASRRSVESDGRRS